MKVFINKWFILILLVVMVINIAVLGTIVFHVLRGGNSHNQRFDEHPPRFFKAMLREHLKEELNMDAAQYAKVEPVLDAFEGQMKQCLDTLKSSQELMFKLLSQPQVDTLQTFQLAEKMGQTHTAMKKNTIRFFIEMKKYCTAEQQTDLHRLFEDRMRFRKHRHHDEHENDQLPPPPPIE